MNRQDILSRFLLLSALASLLIAGWAGLVRMGWQLQPFAAADHGPLMISGFLGTLIALERAVALSAVFSHGRWAYVSPILTMLGAAALVAGLPRSLAISLMMAGSLGLVIVYMTIVRHQPTLFTMTMAIGAVCWLVGNLLWLAGQPIYQLVYWWVNFIVLTIAGERLELSRILRHPRRVHALFMMIVLLLLLSLGLTQVDLNAGVRLEGLAEILLGLWLLRYDLARRTVKQTGMTRYIAVCLLAGYAWLLVGGVLRLGWGGSPAGPIYDALLHSVLLGFTFSMIFGHALMILPAVAKQHVPFKRLFYTHVVLLHASLILRLIGDLGSQLSLRQWGGMLNVVAILLFIGSTVYAVVQHRVSTRRA